MSDLAIDRGSAVTLHYAIHSLDGDLLDSSREQEPMQIVVGDGQLVAAIESELLGHRAGDRFEVMIAPEQYAFGHYDIEKLQSLKSEEFDDLDGIEPGMIIGFDLPDGSEIPGKIVGLSDDLVSIDFNHPLIGLELRYELEIIDVGIPDDD